MGPDFARDGAKGSSLWMILTSSAVLLPPSGRVAEVEPPSCFPTLNLLSLDIDYWRGNLRHLFKVQFSFKLMQTALI